MTDETRDKAHAVITAMFQAKQGGHRILVFEKPYLMLADLQTEIASWIDIDNLCGNTALQDGNPNLFLCVQEKGHSAWCFDGVLDPERFDRQPAKEEDIGLEPPSMGGPLG
jgi:hypothetical protein